MEFLVGLLVRILPYPILDELQSAGLKELDRRGFIIWADEAPEHFVPTNKQE